MRSRRHTTIDQSVPAYIVRINTSSFDVRKHSQHQFRESYLQKFRSTVGIVTKKVLPGKEDRLSRLNLNQIDNLINMERIRHKLADKKQHQKEIFIERGQMKHNQHTNIYQAQFLARINNVAIKRNLRHQREEGFDEFRVLKERRIKEKAEKGLKSEAGRFWKPSVPKKTKKKVYKPEQDDVKSISSISNSIDDFERRMEQGQDLMASMLSVSKSVRKRRKKQWFEGMSRMLIERDKPSGSSKDSVRRLEGYDIEAELAQEKEEDQESLFLSESEGFSRPSSKSRFRTKRIQTVW